ncbi:hypothetical protein ACVWW5_004674 [Bradyrhizobium sp. LM3.4]
MVGKGFRFVSQLLASLSLLIASPLAADEFRSPSLTALRVDWRAALDQLRTEINARPRAADDFIFAPRRSVPRYDPRAMPALVQLNAISSQFFTGIARSSVPVLLPFDAAAYFEALRNGAPATLALSRYQADFNSVDMFDAGPAGYSATFSFEPGAGDGMPSRVFARPVEVQITGSALVYDVADPSGGKGEQVKPLAALYPDLRKFIREGYVRYAFTRFGAAYVVSIQCLDSVAKPRRLACKEAYPVAERFLKALHVAGGQRMRPLTDIASNILDRPTQRSPDFTYRPSGDIIPNTGYRKQGGHPDVMAYAQIRFFLSRRCPRSYARNPMLSATRWRARPAIPGATISANLAVSRSGNAAGVMATRARTSARPSAHRPAKAAKPAIPSSVASSPSAMRWSFAPPRTRPSRFRSTAGPSTSASAICI